MNKLKCLACAKDLITEDHETYYRIEKVEYIEDDRRYTTKRIDALCNDCYQNHMRIYLNGLRTQNIKARINALYERGYEI